MTRPGPHCIATITGRVVDLAAPTPDMIDIEDIAHALANLCRYNGHVEYAYSVAQHSCLVHDVLDEWCGETGPAFDGLMHDAAEAYIGDVSTPMKRLLSGRHLTHALSLIETDLNFAIMAAFDLDIDWAAVKDADQLLYAWERRDVAHVPGIWDVPADLVLPDQVITPWPAAQAKAEFLERFRKYR